jgi:ubiquinone/menaquinone biosynthesis C-methylase UbiE
MTSKDERAAREDFSHRYSIDSTGILANIERRVIGDSWGANGFTTKRQADELARLLWLSGESRLLDIGSGRGWPGLYLARATGCEVVVTDLPLEGLEIARGRAERERISLLSAVASSARHLPFRPHSYDAIVHTDVLC